jgi:hypothetical protein
MTLTIPISAEAEAKLRLRAAASGEDLPSYVARLVEHFAQPPTPLEELSGPVYQKFLESGMTDDELSDLLEKAKHEVRMQRRMRSKP